MSTTDNDGSSADLQEYIRQYLKYYQLNSTLELFQEQTKKRSGNQRQNVNSNSNMNQKRTRADTKLQSMMKCPATKSRNQQQMEKENKQQIKKYQQVLQAGRQIFSVSINLLQIIHNIKEGTVGGLQQVPVWVITLGGSKYESLNDTIQNYKIQLGKHHKIIINEGRVEGSQLISENVIKEHKMKLEMHFNDRYMQGIIEMLLSLRVNALQIAPELRKNLVEQLIRRDIFKITQAENFDFLCEILSFKNKSLRHAVTSLISVIVSTLRGIEYITYNGNQIIIEKIIKILKEQENGNVTQRFCLAILQKCSVKDGVIRVYLQNDMISWVLSLVKKSFNTKIHMFCLDFATAMLANLIHSKTCQVYLQKKPQVILLVMDHLLKFIREPLEVSVLMHLLITLSYLCKQRFKKQMQDAHIVKKISQFVQFYESMNKEEGEAADMDRRTVLDLCSHMFHGKEEDYDTEERIREYQNEQGQLIFECFQDQVN